MATKRIKDITNTAASVASDAYLAIDGTSNGTEKITRDNFRQDTADAFVAAPGTYNLAPLSGGAVPIDKGGTAATTASAARTSLDVPSTSEAALVANNLSDLDSAATARTNLSVNSIDEDAEATGTKLVGPALYFDGVNDYLEVADDAKLSFTDGTDDLPFSVSCFVKMNDWTDCPVISKYGGISNAEWVFYGNGSDYLGLYLIGAGSVYQVARTEDTMTRYEGQWVHVCVTYAGSGPSAPSGIPFTNAHQAVELYINGVLQTKGTPITSGTYAGMSDTTNTVKIGRYSSSYVNGHIRDVKIYNRELTADEVAQLARGTDLGFADEWGGALGGVYTSDFSSTADGFSGSAATLTPNTDAIGGFDDNLTITPDTANSTHIASKTVFTIGLRYRVEADIFVSSGNTDVDSVRLSVAGATTIVESTPAGSTWTHISGEVVAEYTDLYVMLKSGANVVFQDAGGDDLVYIRNIKITEIGTLADFRAENYDSDTGKIHDLSSNGFVGTSANLPTLTGRAYPVYKTGTWTPTLIGSSVSDFTYTTQEGFYTRVGNTVTVNGLITVSALGTSSGYISIGGLPFTTRNTSGQTYSISVGFASAMTGLTSPVTGLFSDGETDIDLYDWGATGVASITEANLTATTSIRFSGTYQIQ